MWINTFSVEASIFHSSKLQNTKAQTPDSLITKQHNSKTQKNKFPNTLITTEQIEKKSRIVEFITIELQKFRFQIFKTTKFKTLKTLETPNPKLQKLKILETLETQNHKNSKNSKLHKF